MEAHSDGYCRAVLARRCSHACSYIAGEEGPSAKALSSAFQSAFNYGFPYYFVRWACRIAEVNRCSAISPIRSTVSECGNRINGVHTSFLCVTCIERFLKIITLPLTAEGCLLSRLAFKALTCLSLPVQGQVRNCTQLLQSRRMLRVSV